jgi:type II secretory ATPase GspE/PulE/Tfp pilus assembly ATPase PilB-like protein
LTQRLVRKTVAIEDKDVRNHPQYAGRVPIAEFAQLDGPAKAAILRRADAAELRIIFGQQSNYATMRAVANDLVEKGLTDSAEVQRVLGEA